MERVTAVYIRHNTKQRGNLSAGWMNGAVKTTMKSTVQHAGGHQIWTKLKLEYDPFLQVIVHPQHVNSHT